MFLASLLENRAEPAKKASKKNGHAEFGRFSKNAGKKEREDSMAPATAAGAPAASTDAITVSLYVSLSLPFVRLQKIQGATQNNPQLKSEKEQGIYEPA